MTVFQRPTSISRSFLIRLQLVYVALRQSGEWRVCFAPPLLLADVVLRQRSSIRPASPTRLLVVLPTHGQLDVARPMWPAVSSYFVDPERTTHSSCGQAVSSLSQVVRLALCYFSATVRPRPRLHCCAASPKAASCQPSPPSPRGQRRASAGTS